MGKMERPDFVRKAIVEGDHDALSAMGKLGSSHRIQRKDFEKAVFEEGARENAKLSPTSKDGDVLPPNPETDEAE